MYQSQNATLQHARHQLTTQRTKDCDQHLFSGRTQDMYPPCIITKLEKTSGQESPFSLPRGASHHTLTLTTLSPVTLSKRLPIVIARNDSG